MAKAAAPTQPVSGEKSTFWVAAGTIGFACLAGLVLLPKLARSSHIKKDGQEAPQFSLPITANGDPGARIDLKEMRGHPVLLDFWASWCGPCAMEAPVIQRISERYKEKGLAVVGVNIEADDVPPLIQRYAADRGLTYPMVSADGATQRAYAVSKLPSLILIDKEGKIASFTVGPLDEGSLSAIIEEAL